MRSMLTWRVAVPALFGLAAIPYVAGAMLTDLAMVAVTLATVLVAVRTGRRVPRAGLYMGTTAAAQCTASLLLLDRLIHGSAAGIVGAVLGATTVLLYLFSVLWLLRARRPEEYLDGVVDAFAALAGMVVIQLQWSALAPDATPLSVATATTPFMGLFCLVTAGMVYGRVALDPSQNRVLSVTITTAGGLMVLAVVGSATFSRPDAPLWSLSAWLVSQYLMAAFCGSRDIARMVQPEPARRRLVEMRWLGPACCLTATPVMLLAFVTRNGVPSVPALAAAVGLTTVALWRTGRLVGQHEDTRRTIMVEQRFRSLLDGATDVILIVDRDLRVTYASGGTEALMHRRSGDLAGLELAAVLGAEAAGSVATTMMTLRQSGAASAPSGDFALPSHAGGSHRYASISVSDHHSTPRIGGWVLNLRDVTERMEAEQELSRLALADALTGLPNRSGLRAELDALLPSNSTSLALLFCDLDGFKAINDGLGHEAGDEVLRQVAGRWSSVLRADDVLGRWGGDEFVVICPAVSTPARAEELAQRLADALAVPLSPASEGPSGATQVGVSIGIAVCRPGEGADSLLARADEAMYEAKRARRLEAA